MDIKKSLLYKALIFDYQRAKVFKRISECYFLINGFSIAQSVNEFPDYLYEHWIFDFLKFTEERLRQIFYPEDEYPLTAHFAFVLEKYVQDEKERLEIFFNLLDEFVELNSTDEK